MDKQTKSGVTLRIPDFIAEDGTIFSEIEITILSDDGDVRDTLRLVEALERPAMRSASGYAATKRSFRKP